MKRQQTINNKADDSRKLKAQADESYCIRGNIALLNNQENTQVVKRMAMNIPVEVRRTFLTPKGRKFPPHEPRSFEFSMDSPTSEHYPALREKVGRALPKMLENYTLFWKDVTGELMPCDNEEDLIKALDVNMQDGPLLLYVQGPWSRPHAGRGCNHGNIQQVTCSGCQGNIEGVRVKCLECEDYNLCADCDSKDIHADHVTVKGDRPRFFNFALPMFAEVIPMLCAEQKEMNKDASLRLCPKDVRQYWQNHEKQHIKAGETTDSDSMEKADAMETSNAVDPDNQAGPRRMCRKRGMHVAKMRMMHQGQCPAAGGRKGWNHGAQKEVTCSGCQGNIEGVRVKCLECEDYNLCADCDSKDIHADHVTVKGDRPRFFNFALPMFAEVIPMLCAEQKEMNKDASLRLCPKDVRQYWQNHKKQHVKAGETTDSDSMEKADAMETSDDLVTDNHDGPRRICRKRGMHVAKMRMMHQGQCPAAGGRKGWNHGTQKQVTCSGCQGNIEGVRVKCLECEDYNLCADCDSKDIHADHVTVKGDRPRFFNFALPLFADVLPKLCSEQRDKNKDGESLRLCPKDVREYWQKHRKEQGPAAESAEGSNRRHKCWERRQHMRKTWQHFLTNIAAEEMETEDPPQASGGKKSQMKHKSDEDDDLADDLTEKVKKIDIQEESQKPEQTHLQQQKREWMQKCHQRWRELMNTESESGESAGRRHFGGIWRPYMRYCWHQWNEQMAETGIKAEHMPGPCRKSQVAEAGPNHANPRRHWIQSCWKMWRSEAARRTKTDKSDEEGACVGADSATEPSEKKRFGNAFPGYHFLMNKSWRMMLNQSHPSCGENVDTEEQVASDKIADCEMPAAAMDVEADLPMEPAKAKHLLKVCWINGCRQLWWMQVKRLMNIDENSDDMAGADKGPTQVKIMEIMKQRPNWRSYMQQCWRLWQRLSNQAGMKQDKSDSLPLGTNLDDDVPDVDQNEKVNPKQSWFKATWEMWKDGMSSQEGGQAKASDPKWNMRPFQGWRPLIVKSWNMLQDEIEKDQGAIDQQITLQKMREAWMKEVENEMKELSHDAKDKTESSKQNTQPRAGSQVGNSSHSRAGPQSGPSNDAWKQQISDLEVKLMKQYWESWKMMEQFSKQPDGTQAPGCCKKPWRQQWRMWKRPRMNKQGHADTDSDNKDDETRCSHVNAPRLRLTLSMKKKDSENH